MYFNTISFKNGRVLSFRTEIPYSVDKTADDWSVVTDAVTGQTLSFRGSEVVTIASAQQTEEKKKTTKKTPKIKASITTE